MQSQWYDVYFGKTIKYQMQRLFTFFRVEEGDVFQEQHHVINSGRH